ncbi:MAG: HAD-IC family P-type ATPase [Candidatus Moranbacteria bacterium]|nr:HAD-IC family P-type ATPase [Candidatus Moranbacteria bacterium]
MVWKKFSVEDVPGTFAELESSEKGLSLEAAKDRLRVDGRNILEEKPFSVTEMFKRRVRSSFLYLLLAAAGLSYFLGERLDAILILTFILINVGLETYQEYHSEKAIRLLKRYLVTHTRVRRSGDIMTIESQEVVLGDIVFVEVGDRLSADVRFIVANGLELDESLITGESLSAHKIMTTLPVSPAEMYEAKNIGFAGTTVTAGRGEGIVFATGKNTALGDIASLSEENGHKTTFEKGIAEFSRFILKLVLFTITLVFIANVIIKGGDINTVELLIFSLALAVSVVPEALPVIITVALSRGALRLAEKKVVVKRLSAIEDLGSIEILCTDKTGTLTENILSVSRIQAHDESLCLQLALAASLEEPVDRGRLHDAFDLALWKRFTKKEHDAVRHLRRIDTIPFDPERRRNSVLVETADKKKEIIVRGAPEEIIRLSRNVDAYTTQNLLSWMKEAGERGERVLAVAHKPFSLGRKYTLYEEQQLEFVGLISFADPLKKTAKETLKRAAALNVGVKILTGDSAEVAGAVGCAVGLLAYPGEVITGKALTEMTDEDRKQAVFSHSVFARVSPREKYEIIRILQEKHAVGFLGDGINDAPALKLADVALVVQGATDIAREAADVVLLQKSLETVIDGVKEGRVIFANILKYLKITLTSNFGNFYSVALVSLFLPFVPLLPIQILLLNLLSDFPMIAIATDTVDHEELEKPRSYHIHAIILVATLLGGISSLFDFMLFGVFAKVSPEALQTAWFVLSVITEVILIFSLRTKFAFFRARRPSFLLSFLSLAVLFGALVLPFIAAGRQVLHFIKPDASFIIIIVGLVAGYFVATEAVKFFYYHHFHREHSLRTKRKRTSLAHA